MSARILVLTEDTGHDAVPTFRALLGRILLRYEDGREIVRIRPSETGECPSVGSNFWRSNKEQFSELRRKLCNGIANALAAGEIVLFHTDADASWSVGYAQLAKEFDEKIRVQVQRVLVAAARRDRRDDDWAETLLLRLIHVVPTWSVEAWTYQATAKALELCRTKYGGRDTARFMEWEADRGLLDEEKKPKEQVCLGNRHNAELAGSVPVVAVVAANKSLAHFIQDLRTLTELSSRMRL